MAVEEEIHDSPTGWVAKHVRGYLDSDGARGGEYRGVPALLLTTRGRKSGLLRRTALYYGQDGDTYLVVASNGGSAAHPSWYLSLAADPEVTVQVGADRFTGRARVAEGAERQRLWEVMTGVWKHYDVYREKAPREIPLVVLERV